MRGFLDQVHFNNTLFDYFVATAIIVVGILMIKVVKGTLLRGISAWARRTRTPFDDLILNSIDRFGFPALYFLVIYIGLRTLQLPLRGQHI
ncbi:MAG: mechanosensitive ion channel family protein, partial [Bacteroidota bacterium]|nr:mechanosensitive ion channel family protein [Bacteroidota bacterium]